MATIAYQSDGTIQIPPEISKQLGWTVDLELEPQLAGKVLQLVPAVSPAINPNNSPAARLSEAHRITHSTTNEILDESRSEI